MCFSPSSPLWSLVVSVVKSFGAPKAPISGPLQAADEDVDQVLAVGRLEAVLAKHAYELRLVDGLAVGADEDFGDGALHADGARGDEGARQLVEDLAVGDGMAAERVESADLRARFRHARDSGGDRAQLRGAERAIAPVRLRDLHVASVGAADRADHLRARLR